MNDLALHVRAFVPTAAGAELQHREALLKARDWAAALRARTANLQAFNWAVEAHETAGAFVYADESEQRLEAAVKLCRHLVAAAMLAEQLDPGEVGHG